MQFDEVLRTWITWFGTSHRNEGPGNEELGYASSHRCTRHCFLLSLPGLDRERVREYFSEHGLLKIYDELEKDRG